MGHIQPEWQPIETAPRDGTEVVLYYPGLGKRLIGSFFFQDVTHDGVFSHRSEGWLMSSRFYVDEKPTLWAPLPAIPA